MRARVSPFRVISLLRSKRSFLGESGHCESMNTQRRAPQRWAGLGVHPFGSGYTSSPRCNGVKDTLAGATRRREQHRHPLGLALVPCGYQVVGVLKVFLFRRASGSRFRGSWMGATGYGSCAGHQPIAWPTRFHAVREYLAALDDARNEKKDGDGDCGGSSGIK